MHLQLTAIVAVLTALHLALSRESYIVTLSFLACQSPFFLQGSKENIPFSLHISSSSAQVKLHTKQALIAIAAFGANYHFRYNRAKYL